MQSEEKVLIFFQGIGLIIVLGEKWERVSCHFMAWHLKTLNEERIFFLNHACDFGIRFYKNPNLSFPGIFKFSFFAALQNWSFWKSVKSLQVKFWFSKNKNWVFRTNWRFLVEMKTRIGSNRYRLKLTKKGLLSTLRNQGLIESF